MLERGANIFALQTLTLFLGFNGPINHDCLSHARSQHLLEYYLSRHGISAQEYCDQCWNKDVLIKNNIIVLAQRAQGCFMHFHEVPSVSQFWRCDDVSSLIFPETTGLTERVF